VEILMRARRNADRCGRAHAGDLVLVIAVVVEDLDALVAEVGHVDVALGIDAHRHRHVELAGFGAARAPALYESPALVEFDDARVGVGIGNEHVALGIPCDVGGPIEAVTGNTLSGSAASSPASAAAAFATTTPLAAGGCGRRIDRLRLTAEHLQESA